MLVTLILRLRLLRLRLHVRTLVNMGTFFHLISVTKSFISVCWILLLKRALSRTYFIHSSFLSSNRTIRVGTLVSNWAFFTDNVVCFTFILFLIRRSLGQNSSSFRLLLQYLLSSNQRLSLLSRFIFIIKPTTFILYPRFFFLNLIFFDALHAIIFNLYCTFIIHNEIIKFS